MDLARSAVLERFGSGARCTRSICRIVELRGVRGAAFAEAADDGVPAAEGDERHPAAIALRSEPVECMVLLHMVGARELDRGGGVNLIHRSSRGARHGGLLHDRKWVATMWTKSRGGHGLR